MGYQRFVHFAASFFTLRQEGHPEDLDLKGHIVSRTLKYYHLLLLLHIYFC